MDITMNLFLKGLMMLVPAIIVFLTAYYLVKSFLDNDARKRLTEIRIANQNLITPTRLQAYERLALFLERISPNSLIPRVNKQGMSARLLQTELIKAIRNEFEHNLSQQIYVSGHSWEMVKTAKEEIIKLINISSTKIPDTASSMDLSQMIINISAQVPKLPTDVALEYIKREVGQNF
ncbi:MAG TPA: hypothetical protein VNZ86_06765 [Bacteroidia bacterium]|jgi:hypothetical protein|nr:hypothetical protein [Bacteroidia bacterium]